MTEYIDVVFDKDMDMANTDFVEVEDDQGHGVRIGEWLTREDGFRVLRIGWTAIGDLP
jgi:hypothetical protein